MTATAPLAREGAPTASAFLHIINQQKEAGVNTRQTKSTHTIFITGVI
jgi:hypothetical protein